MTDDILESAIVKLTLALQQYEQSHITGALLGEMVRREAPEFNVREAMRSSPGLGKLRHFVEHYLKALLSPDGNQGSDVRYRINKNNFEQPFGDNPQLWQAFVRPRSLDMLVVQENQLGVMPRTSALQISDSKLIIIPSARPEELEQIRKDFVASLEEKAVALPDIVAPYNEWIAALKTLGEKDVESWAQYRPAQIIVIFENRLASLNISPQVRATLCTTMQRSYMATKRTDDSKKAKDQPARLTNDGDAKAGEADFRTVMLHIIRNLPIADLREIKLPAGAMFDAMSNQGKK